jgi:hypothetical protein
MSHNKQIAQNPAQLHLYVSRKFWRHGSWRPCRPERIYAARKQPPGISSMSRDTANRLDVYSSVATDRAPFASSEAAKRCAQIFCRSSLANHNKLAQTSFSAHFQMCLIHDRNRRLRQSMRKDHVRIARRVSSIFL